MKEYKIYHKTLGFGSINKHYKTIESEINRYAQIGWTIHSFASPTFACSATVLILERERTAD